MSQNLAKQSAEQRLNYLLKQVNEQLKIWILTDEHGCVILKSDDEDCVPIWPAEEFAAAWADGEWATCQPQAISLETWQSRWTPGLTDDEVSIAVFPNQFEEGVVLFPYEFEQALKLNGGQAKVSH